MIQVSDDRLAAHQSGEATVVYEPESDNEAWISGFVEVPR